MSSRLSLLLPPMGKCEARSCSVIRVGGRQSKDWGSEHVAGNLRQTGVLLFTCSHSLLFTVSLVFVQSGNKHLYVCVIRRLTCSECSWKWRQAVNWRRWSSEWLRCWIRSSQTAGKNCQIKAWLLLYLHNLLISKAGGSEDLMCFSVFCLFLSFSSVKSCLLLSSGSVQLHWITLWGTFVLSTYSRLLLQQTL